jgi:K+-sensing histidine kinase KdpD
MIPQTIELLDTIDAQARALLRFVNELLDLSRISHGLIEIAPERLDVAGSRGNRFKPFNQ